MMKITVLPELAAQFIVRLKTKYGTYEDEQGEWINAPCACSECRDGQAGKLDHRYGQGHFACGVCPDDLLQAEELGLVGAMYVGNSWRWFFVD